ncbi:hypothetical protein ACFL3Q_12405 [Planctomycetota bacterium]
MAFQFPFNSQFRAKEPAAAENGGHVAANTVVVEKRAMGFEPTTFSLGSLQSPCKYLPYLFLRTFFGVKNQWYSDSILVINWQWRNNRVETDARMTPRVVALKVIVLPIHACPAKPFNNSGSSQYFGIDMK